MTSVTSDRTTRKSACVTGGDGYIASALVKMLLEKGYAVKTTVRKSGKIVVLLDPSLSGSG
jgi:anthocyanidin reductase